MSGGVTGVSVPISVGLEMSGGVTGVSVPISGQVMYQYQ